MHAPAIEFNASGIPRAAADARYVRRFVGATLAADSYQISLFGGGVEAVLGNPNGGIVGGLPADTSDALLNATDNGRFATRASVIRALGTPTLRLFRADGSLQAPAAVASLATIGTVAYSCYDGATGPISAQVVARLREAASPLGIGSQLELRATDIGAVIDKGLMFLRGGGANVAEWLAAQSTGRLIPSVSFQARNPANTQTWIEWNATGLGFFGVAPIARPTITGSRAGNAAVASIAAQLAALGLVIDSTTP